MKNIYVFFILTFFLLLDVKGQVSGDFRSKTSGPGTWNDFNSWETYNGTTWVAATTGQLPLVTSAVEIKAGDVMIINATGLVSGNLTINGSLTYHATTVSALSANGSVTVGATGSFTSPASGTVVTHALNIGGSTATGVGGNLVVNGLFNMNVFSTAGVVVTFYGTSNNSISGTGTTINFYSLVVNKGTTNASVLEATSVITCADATAAAPLRLSVTVGSFKLSSASTLRPFYGSSNPTQSQGALWINNAAAIIQGVGAGTAAGPAGTLTFSGLLQIDAGTLSYGNGASFLTCNGNFTLDGVNGTLNVYGSFTGGSTYNITAGNINIYPQVGANSNPMGYFTPPPGLFQFTGTALNFTGGTLTIVDPSPQVPSGLYYAPYSLFINGGTNNFVGSTIRFGNGVSDLPGGIGFTMYPTVAPLGNVILNNAPTSVSTSRYLTLVGNNANIGGNLTINSGAANRLQMGTFALNLGGNLTNGGTMTSNNVATNGLTFNGTTQQTITNTGTFFSSIPNLTINNSATANPSVDLQVPLTVTTGFTLTNGKLGSSNATALTLGNSAVSTTLTMTRSGGSLAFLPVFALTGVTYNANYNAPTIAGTITTGFELSSTLNLGTLTVNNTNGVILDKPIACTTLALTSGVLTSTSTNSVTVIGTLPANITGGSATSYVNGPLTLTIPNNAVGANYKFPIGKTSYRLFEFSSLSTGGTGTGTFTAEAFDAGSYTGTAGTGLSVINTDKYWTLKGTLGTVTITSSNIRLTDVGLIPVHRIGQSGSALGTYNNVGGLVTGGTTIASTNSIDYSALVSGTFFRIGSATGISGGTYAIGPQPSYTGYAGTFPTFASAATAVTGVPISGNIIFEFQPDYVPTVETYPVAFNSNIISSATVTITFRPAASVSSVINFSGTTSIITNAGADYITFDGRNGGTGTNKYFQFTSSSTTVPVIVLSGDALYNQILYSVVKGSNSTATTGSIVAINAPVTGNNFYTIDHCNFDASVTANNGLYTTGVATDATITNNNFFDFKNGAGINIAGGSNNALIDNNNFYQTTNYTGFAGTTSGIIITGGNNVRISNNNIGGSGPALAGTWTVSATAPAAYNFTGINATSLATTSKIYNNKIQNFDWKSTPATWTGITASGVVNIGTDGANFIGANTGNDNIKVTYFTTNGGAQINGIVATSGATVNIENNNIGSITTLLSGVTGVGSSITGISNNATTATVRNNIIGSTTTAKSINTANQTTTGNAQNIYGIVAGGTTNTVTGNTIANLYSDMTFASTSAGMIRGIKIGNGSYYGVNSNSIYSLSTPQPMTGLISAGSSNHSIVGIDINATNNTSLCNITGNTIYDLTNTATSAAVAVLGIYCQTSTSYGAIFDKNFIHSFSTASNTAVQTGIHLNYGGPCTIQNNVIRLGIDKAGNSITTTAQINGIVKAAFSLCNIYFNTVVIGGSGVAAGTIKTYAFYLSSHATEDIRNNIFDDVRTNTVANPLNYAIYLSGTLTSGFNSDYNIYNVSPTDGKLSSVGAVDKLTLNALQNAVPGYDIHSGFGDPLLRSPFTSMATMDLRPANITSAEGTGIPVATVTDDITGALRSSNTPTDIGAYSGNFTQTPVVQDIFSPSITYNNLGNGSSTVSRLTANFAAITDNVNGINVTSGTRPRLYYKLSTNANAFVGNTAANNGWKWVEATGTTSPFNFNIDYSLLNGGPVVSGSVIQYFVVAQNLATVPAVSFTPSIGASGTSVATTGMTAPTTPNSYTIVSSLPSTINVGTGQTYTSLTGTLASGGLFAAINAGAINVNTVVTITSDLIETGTTSLNLVNEEGPNTGTLTLTIQSDGNPHIISGTAVTANAPMISITGAVRLTIDGGTNKLLTFRNTNATATSTGPVIQFNNSSQNCILKNCIIESNSTTLANGAVTIGANGSNNVMINNNDIRDARGGTLGSPTTGIYSNYNGNTLSITNNNIYNQKNATSYGIYLYSVANGCIVTGNSFYLENGNTTPGPYTGIFLQNSYNHLVSANYIGGSAPLCGGSVPFTVSGATNFTGIYLYLTSAQTSTIQGNTIQNISMTNTGSPSFYGINNTMYGQFTIVGNTIGSATTANSIQIAGTGISAGINQTYNYTTFPCTMDQNTIANITLTNTSGAPIFYGMKTYGCMVRKNLIYNIGTSTNIAVTLYGIYNYFNNANSFTNEFSNNVISLSGGASTTPTIYGFYELGANGTYGFYYNSINLFGNATGTASTYAFYRGAASTYNINNNILVNSRTGGTGTHYAIYSIPTTLFTSNNNDIYVAGTILGHFGTAGIANDKANLSAWKALQLDINSISVDPLFSSSTNLLPLNSSPVNASGIPVSVTTDFNGKSRSLTAPSIGAYELDCISPTNGGTIASNQIICNSSTPGLITNTMGASGYSGNLEYKWQSTVSPFTNWTDISNSNAATFQSALISQTTKFKRLARTTCMSGWNGAVESNIVTITVESGVAQAGTIKGPDTFIPGSTGVGYSVDEIPNATSYIWSYSGTGVTIQGSGNNVTLDFALSATAGTLEIKGQNSCGDGLSTNLNIAMACLNPTNGGTIAADQIGCGSFTPAVISSTTLPSGYIGTLEYKWQISTTNNSVGFTDIAGANSPTFAPALLNQTAWFKRLARVSCMVDWSGAAESNVITMTVNPIPDTPTASVTQQPTCSVATGTIIVTAPTGSGLTYSIDDLTYSNTDGVFNLVTPGTYHVTVKNSTGCVSGATSVTINGQPQITAQPVAMEVCTGDVVTFGISACSAVALSYQWQISYNGLGDWTNVTNGAPGPYSGTQTPTLKINPARIDQTNSLYRCVVTNIYGTTTSVPALLKVNNCTISGNVRYNNANQDILAGMTVTANNKSSVVDAQGNYTITGVVSGIQNITVTPGSSYYVGSVNATDAGAVNNWFAHQNPLPYVKFLSGDVNGDGSITSTDALLIQLNFVTGRIFNRKPWSFWCDTTSAYVNQIVNPGDPTKVNVNGQSLVLNLLGQVTGDFNGSFNPLLPKSKTSSLEITNVETIKSGANQDVELPIRAGSAMEVGAISLILNIPSDLVEVKDVYMKNDNNKLSFNVNGNELRIAWNSLTPVSVQAAADLVVLKLKTTAAFTEGKTIRIKLVNDPLNEIVNGSFKPIPQPVMNIDALISTSKNPSLVVLSSYPNPFSDFTTISYTLPVNSNVTLQIYNILGGVVKTIVDKNQLAGSYTFRLDASMMTQGFYYATLRVNDGSKVVERTVKLIMKK